MATAILMPKLGLTMTEGTVDAWYKQAGDSVEKGEVIATISSEKLTHDVEAPEAGVLQIVTAEEQEQVCKEPIGYVGAAGEEVATVAVPEEPVISNEATAEAPIEVKAPVRQQGTRIFITPIARKIAAERGYDYTQIPGTGGNGRITRRDVESYVSVAEAAPVKAISNTGEGLTGMRKVIAKRMHASLHDTAQVTLHRKANISSLMKFREKMKKKLGDEGKASLGINVLLTRAVVLALKDHPEMNASYANGEHTKHEAIHIGMAVAVDAGLIVPVMRDATNQSLSQLADSLQNVATGARNNTLSSDLLSGSTFTISNLGHAGVEYFTPILNTPEIGILGVGALSTKLVFTKKGKVKEQQELPLSLTFDHQVVDGAPAGEFLQTICQYLENPYRLVF
ncbi:dihydrolipoamide acetyltransferase family protein [Kurthia sp. Dielmo]|uniref:dihydrolipoamide acetyltransferase family protein n=1 Tax=Kurthia sp. Dielmo TaxID=1033738 RepID=UPI00111D8D96|nr:dihydrolipoamide acetyltransferase family protein [Kurthia sp. Dielmo]